MSLKVLLMAMSMAAGSTFGIVAQSAAVVDVLKEKVAEPWRGKEPDWDAYRIGLRQQSFVRGHRCPGALSVPLCASFYASLRP